jgi:hypothetical protein
MTARDSLVRPYGETVRFRETTVWPWWAVLTSVGLVALIGASFDRALGFMWPWVGWVGFAIGLVGVCWAIWATRLKVQADRSGLWAGQAFLPRNFIGRVYATNGAEANELRTVKADARAFTAARSWVKGAVLIEVTDEADPHPYWYVSAKRPDSLKDVLTKTTDEKGQQIGDR